MKSDYKFSVLMSVYIKENANYFKESLESVYNQKLVPDQVVLVEDGPLTEELYQVIEEFKKYSNFTVVKLKENKGLTNALNKGLEYCEHNLVARMDSDDIANKERFLIQIEACKNNPDYAIIGSDVTEFYEDKNEIISKRVMPKLFDEIFSFSQKRNPFNHPSVIYKKDVILSLGGYEVFPYFEDYNLWVKVLQAGHKTMNLPEFLVNMRTPLDFYKRRGGFKYFQHMKRFKRHLLEVGHMSKKQYIFNVFFHSLIALSPVFIRKIFYKTFLRKK